MHIEPGVVDGAKMVFAYGTAAAATGYSVKLVAADLAKSDIITFAARTVLATVGVFVFFEVLPHFAVGVSEVHLILGTTLFLFWRLVCSCRACSLRRPICRCTLSM